MVTISFTLVTLMSDSGVILQGDASQSQWSKGYSLGIFLKTMF